MKVFIVVAVIALILAVVFVIRTRKAQKKIDSRFPAKPAVQASSTVSQVQNDLAAYRKVQEPSRNNYASGGYIPRGKSVRKREDDTYTVASGADVDYSGYVYDEPTRPTWTGSSDTSNYSSGSSSSYDSGSSYGGSSSSGSSSSDSGSSGGSSSSSD